MTIDIITPDGVAVDVKDAIGDLALKSSAELIGLLVQTLTRNGTLSHRELLDILPFGYEVRINV